MTSGASRIPLLAVRTARLSLAAPTEDDADELFAIQSDARVWTHYPSLRYVDREKTRTDIRRCRRAWHTVGLASWTVREIGSEAIIGFGGCSATGEVWNLGYRLRPEAQGHGYATELAREAIRCAREQDPERPVVAKLLEHNTASARVAERLGFGLAYRGFDVGNPDAAAVRLIYADRTLTFDQIAGLAG